MVCIRLECKHGTEWKAKIRNSLMRHQRDQGTRGTRWGRTDNVQWHQGNRGLMNRGWDKWERSPDVGSRKDRCSGAGPVELGWLGELTLLTNMPLGSPGMESNWSRRLTGECVGSCLVISVYVAACCGHWVVTVGQRLTRHGEFILLCAKTGVKH
jgi:hypothetical protein